MTPGVYNLTIYCGTTQDAATLRFTYKVGTTPVNLSGFSARAQARGPKGLIFSASSANGTILLGGADGTIALQFSAEDTSAMWRDGLPGYQTPGGTLLYHAGAWDLELQSADARVTRLLAGKLFLSPEVSV